MSSSYRAISVRGLSKSYTIVGNVEKHITLAETLLDRVKNPFRRAKKEIFWALDNVEFEVNQGDVVGIIGRNGAGKSTLLKILSEITEPTSGEVQLFGRVGSLLEVGTGFHPELTGRENIFLNGAILGMSRREIIRQFDAIVDFAEVSTFLDTPVKRYSSGMYVRLAFAVAAHLNPEILIVDEVLAVGDAAFQQKCLGKMGDVAKSGRTVLFVSHNTEAVRRLCSRCVLIDDGSVMIDGTTTDTLRVYSDLLRDPARLATANLKNRLNRTSGDVRFTRLAAYDADGTEAWTFATGETIRLRMYCQVLSSVPSLGIYLAVKSCLSNEVITSCKEIVCNEPLCPGDSEVFTLEISGTKLRPGEYSLYAAIGDAACTKFYDVMDENVNIPLLCITTDERDPHLTVGYFSMNARVLSHTQEADLN